MFQEGREDRGKVSDSSERDTSSGRGQVYQNGPLSVTSEFRIVVIKTMTNKFIL